MTGAEYSLVMTTHFTLLLRVIENLSLVVTKYSPLLSSIDYYFHPVPSELPRDRKIRERFY